MNVSRLIRVVRLFQWTLIVLLAGALQLALLPATGCRKKLRNPSETKSQILRTHITSAAWSPDGKHLALIIGSDVNPWKRLIGVSKSDGDDLLFQSPLRLWDGRVVWNRGGSVIFATERSSGANQIWKIPTSGGQPVRLTKLGGTIFHCGLQDEKIFYLNEHDDRSEIFVMNLNDKSIFTIPTTFSPIALPGIDWADESLLYCAAADEGWEFRLYDLVTGTDSGIGITPKPVRDISWDRTGEHFCFIMETELGDCLFISTVTEETLLSHPVYRVKDSSDHLSYPSWSPAKDHILLIEGKEGRLLRLKVDVSPP